MNKEEVAHAVLFTSYFTMLYIFLGAYLAPAKYSVVPVNLFGEADVELLLILITAPAVLWYMYKFFEGLSMAKDIG